ncbi:MAG TPA: type II and III secretion system protein [Balneolales bacterium]|nr:type II and III secretion system protein [Balneolales bacterium]
MRKTCSIILLILLLTGLKTISVQAQDNQVPIKVRNSPNQIITLSKEMTFAQAIDVLNTYAQKFSNKFILNNTKVKGPVGVSLPPMNWRNALKYLAKIKNLDLVEHSKYFELMPHQVQNTQAQTSTQKADKLGVTTKTREVRISATFFEGDKKKLRELGIDWSTFKDGIVQINNIGAQNVSQNVFSAQTLKNIEIGHTGIKVNALFKTFEANNLGQILARPTIKVMNDKQGHIQVGQDFSINQRDFSGNVVSKFFSTGTILTVTPHIITQHDTTFIYMKVHAERSTAQPDPVSTIVNKQTSDSYVMLLSGESTVIAGLYSTETDKVRKGIPILKDLPPWFFGLRYLFGYTSKQYTEKELIIILKATISPDLKQRMAQEKKSTQELLNDTRKKMNNNNYE